MTASKKPEQRLKKRLAASSSGKSVTVIPPDRSRVGVTGPVGPGPARRECRKAIAQDAYGETDVLQLRDIDKPELTHDEVLVRVHAAGVDRGVWHLMTGPAYPIRLTGYGLQAPKTVGRAAGCRMGGHRPE
jgi:hypothetical protein